MISREKEQKLICIYFYICDLYENELKYNCQRFSYNSKPEFTDQEIMTIYLFAGHDQRYFQINVIYLFTIDYLSSWFPKLPSYQTFSYRLNLLTGTFQALVCKLISSFKPENYSNLFSIVDSMPIITSSGRNRTGKVASEITSKGFCSTKNMYYYGCKIQTMANVRPDTIPFPESMIITSAEDNSDKAYFDKEYFNENKRKTQDVEMLTPIKGIKGQTEEIKQRDKVFNDLFSYTVSKVRQPIESFFNWLNEKTKIQRAMKVRSTAGLLINLFGKMSMAFINLIF